MRKRIRRKGKEKSLFFYLIERLLGCAFSADGS
jgi:hypothetical protein